MQTFKQILLIVVIVALVAFGVCKMQTPAPLTNAQTVQTTTKEESVYDRVMRTKTLRCGYISWPPFIDKDIKTGQFSGFFYDYMAAIGDSIGVKIEWVEEINISDGAAALNTGRIDAFCVALGAIPARAINMYLTKPMMYYPYHAYVRTDDTRFDNNMAAANNASITLSTMEGEYTSIYARSTFPKAKVAEITNLQGNSVLFLNVVDKKADMVFQDPASFRAFDEKNKGKLKLVPGGFAGSIPGGFPVKYGEEEFKRIFDYAIDDVTSRFVAQRLFQQYGFTESADMLMPAPDFAGEANAQK